MNEQMKQKEPFAAPTLDIIVWEATDVITTSGGGFEGEWDMNIPEI